MSPFVFTRAGGGVEPKEHASRAPAPGARRPRARRRSRASPQRSPRSSRRPAGPTTRPRPGSTRPLPQARQARHRAHRDAARRALGLEQGRRPARGGEIDLAPFAREPGASPSSTRWAATKVVVGAPSTKGYRPAGFERPPGGRATPARHSSRRSHARRRDQQAHLPSSPAVRPPASGSCDAACPRSASTAFATWRGALLVPWPCPREARSAASPVDAAASPAAPRRQLRLEPPPRVNSPGRGRFSALTATRPEGPRIGALDDRIAFDPPADSNAERLSDRREIRRGELHLQRIAALAERALRDARVLADREVGLRIRDPARLLRERRAARRVASPANRLRSMSRLRSPASPSEPAPGRGRGVQFARRHFREGAGSRRSSRPSARNSRRPDSSSDPAGPRSRIPCEARLLHLDASPAMRAAPGMSNRGSASSTRTIARRP